MGELFLIVLGAFGTFGFGMLIGSKWEAAYWADHARDNGFVYHKGAMYKVTRDFNDE